MGQRTPTDWPLGGGELGSLIRRFDWGKTSLGPVAEWPQSLRTATDILLRSPVPMVLLSGEDGVMIYNDAYSVFAGGRHPRLLGSKVREGWEEVADFNDNVLRVGLAGGTLAYEDQELTLFRHGVPEQVWMDLAFSPVLDESGRPGGVIAIVIETTAKIRTERSLRQSEAQFRSFAQAVPNHVWTSPPDGQLDWFNERVYEYCGAARGELDGDRWATIVHPDDLPAAAARWAASLASGTVYERQFRIRRADGAYRWHIVRAVPIRGEAGDIVRWVGTNTDIEDQKAMSDALAHLNATLEQQVEQRTADRDRMWRLSTDVMVVADFEANITAVNPAWTVLLGWEAVELIGRSFLDLVHPEDREATLRQVRSSGEGATTFRFENRYQRKDGRYLTLSWTAVPDARFIHGVGRDVSAERDAAKALRLSEAALHQSQKMEAVGQLTGGVAHDFNNLLTVIRSSVDLLKRPDLSEERRQRYIEAISDTTARAARLTGQLLAFARRQALQPEVFDVVQSVAAMADMIVTLTGSRIRIETRVPGTPCWVHADPSQFDTALLNLAVNARDAMDGEGRLTITLQPVSAIPPRRLHGARPGDFIAVAVTDTGSGIAAADMQRIFEPFFTTKEVGKGTGLGLSQVIGFAKQSDGDVSVETEAGRGSTFTLYLPRAEPGAEDVAVAPASERLVDGHGTRILVVEDNPDVGMFATQTLQELGYATVLATNAEAALSELATDAGRFDVVFSDVVMPGMNGIDLGQEIRRRYADLPVVLTSGYSHVLAENGAYGFELLQKPYSIEQLSRVLRKAAVWRRRKRALDASNR